LLNLLNDVEIMDTLEEVENLSAEQKELANLIIAFLKPGYYLRPSVPTGSGPEAYFASRSTGSVKEYPEVLKRRIIVIWENARISAHCYDVKKFLDGVNRSININELKIVKV